MTKQISKTYQRIQGRAGKLKHKVVVCINSLVATRHQAYSNHIQFFFRLGRNYPNVDFILFNPDRMSIDRARNSAAELALEQEADYLLFLDDDVIIPMDSLGKLIEADADIVAGDVCIRGYPFDHMLFYWTKNKEGLKAYSKLPSNVPNNLLDVGAVGFSLCLIKTSLIQKLSKPYFITGVNNTEDIYFCLKAHQEVPKVSIKGHLGLVCYHLLWDEAISSNNKKAFKKYYETMNPGVLKKVNDDRGAEYLMKAKRTVG
jgi:GT2 family glycosyltransferase